MAGVHDRGLDWIHAHETAGERTRCHQREHGGDNRIGAARVNLRVPPHCFLRLPEMNCGERGLVGPITITNLGADMSAVLIKIIPIADQPRSYTISTANPVVSVLGTGAPTLQTWIELARTYVNYGIDRSLLGADHLLFVLGLIWIVGGGWRLVKTITAFTIGHSASLAAAAFGLVSGFHDEGGRESETNAWRGRARAGPVCVFRPDRMIC
jgi:HupE / UreJ protein